MRSGITFTDKREALDYKSTMEREGHSVELIKLADGYKVVLTGKSLPVIAKESFAEGNEFGEESNEEVKTKIKPATKEFGTEEKLREKEYNLLDKTEFPNINQLTDGRAARYLKEDPSYKQWFEFLEIYYKIGLEKATSEEIDWAFHLVSSEIPQIKERLEQYAGQDFPDEVDAMTENLIPELQKAVAEGNKIMAIDYFAFQQHSAAGIDPRLPLHTFGMHKPTHGLDIVIEVLQKMREENPPKDVWSDTGFFE